MNIAPEFFMWTGLGRFFLFVFAMLAALKMLEYFAKKMGLVK